MTDKVVLVGPGALLALLRTVAFGWQQDSLSTSARELLALGQELYRRLATLGTHAAKMGRSLHATVESYNQFVGALESRVFVTARRMQELELVTDDLPDLGPVETGPRVLTAVELLEVVGAEDGRAELLLDLGVEEHRGRDQVG
jgi:DNA recombination protein RmuC